MDNINQDELVIQKIENLGPFIVNDIDMTQAVISKIKQVLMIIMNNEQISFSQAYEKIKQSPIYSLLTDDYIEALSSNIEDIFDAYKELENRKQR